VHISTHLSEDVLRSIVTYVEEKFNQHEKAVGYKADEDNRKIDALIITLLDIAAELISARQEIRKLKLSDIEARTAMDFLSKQLDDFSKQIEK
jgi:hypothetical protein